MITATVTAIRSSHNGGIPFAFAKATELQSDYNPDGFVTFTIAPQTWSGRELPRIGDTVALGQLKKKVRPEWPAPRWRAFEAKPINGTPIPRVRVSAPIPIPQNVKYGWLDRLLVFFRPGRRTDRRAICGTPAQQS